MLNLYQLIIIVLPAIPKFDSHTMGHAFFSGEVHLNGGLKWRIPYLHKNNDKNNNLPISQRNYDLQKSLTHVIIHTFGVGHTKKGLRGSFYDDSIKIFKIMNSTNTKLTFCKSCTENVLRWLVKFKFM